MSRWTPLPQTLEPEVALLAERLRELKDRSGLSLVSLADRTANSKSSWDRYLNGKKLPPQQAVRALSQIAQQDAGHLDALWESADRAWSRRGGRAQLRTDIDEQPETRESSAVEPHAEAPRLPVPFRPPFGRHKWLVIAGALAAISLGVSAWWLASGTSSVSRTNAAAPSLTSGRILLSPACAPVVSMGQHDTCVREVQRLLRTHGATLAVDGDFGPETSRRLTAFQVLAGLPANGVVDQATAAALYGKQVSMTGWSPQQVEKRIREVFTTAPDKAVAIARCQSFLDPLYELPNADGTRNWGVFQISDGRLDQFGGTLRQALDPEWNIQTAYKLWKLHNGFSDWPFCEQAFLTPSASPHAR